MTSDGDRVKDLCDIPLIPAAEAAFDQIPDVVFFVKDRQARYVSVNQTLVERCGVNGKEDLVGKTVLDIFPGPMGEGYYQQDMQVLEGEAPVKDLLELHLYVRGEPGWCITNKIPLARDDDMIVGLIGTSRDLHVPADEAKGHRELAMSIRYIQTHYGETLRVEELSRMSSLSVYQFEQRMKKIFQITAGQFIAKVRIEAACDLLRSPEKSIAEVAVHCGFYDQSAFARQFKATTGLTPSEYRARAK